VVNVYANREEVPMRGPEQEVALTQMLLLVEAAQRAGRSEDEISETVQQAVAADAKLDRAA
jgi:hypothetical protein